MFTEKERFNGKKMFAVREVWRKLAGLKGCVGRAGRFHVGEGRERVGEGGVRKTFIPPLVVVSQRPRHQ